VFKFYFVGADGSRPRVDTIDPYLPRIIKKMGILGWGKAPGWPQSLDIIGFAIS